ncbi:hypothetical protein [Anaeromicropila populeti]|uniref:Uncharacterized protein n=1 Tax=Anaeromicropila populeti TaxID=37658 RepID=A0A1I6HIS8_9FIRM|nr:hypothetical protein [Anaeromicropila populeti]SFR54385.1 hypothetical protein SAMN05661086_00026 [Anaeromicropila populeti]
MGFYLGEIIQETNAGRLKGIQREVACYCWFTSQGEMTPRMIKIMDEEGRIHTIQEIRVLCSEPKNYSGIATVEYICKIRYRGMEETVKLVYTKENCKWAIIRV